MLPGLKRRPGSLWPLFLIVAIVIFVTIVVWQLVNEKEGTTPKRSIATGRVTQVERIGGNVAGAAEQNFVKYQFMAGDKVLTGNEIVEYRAATPALGDEIRVSYDAATPQDNYRAPSETQIRSEQQTKKILLALVPVGAFLWLFFMSFAFLPIAPRDWLNWRRARGLYRNGEITSGRVQFVRLESALRSPNHVVGAYESSRLTKSRACVCWRRRAATTRGWSINWRPKLKLSSLTIRSNRSVR